MLALPHQVVPVPATTDALSLVLYVKSSKCLAEMCTRILSWKTYRHLSTVMHDTCTVAIRGRPSAR